MDATDDCIRGTSGPHYYVQGGGGLFYAAFRGRMDGALVDYEAEYAAFERAARSAVLQAGRPYVSLFDMRDAGSLNAGFARWALRTFGDPVYCPIVRAMFVSESPWADVQARVLQIGTLGRVRVFGSHAERDATDYLHAALPKVLPVLNETLRSRVTHASSLAVG